jgi:hypothetical protein
MPVRGGTKPCRLCGKSMAAGNTKPCARCVDNKGFCVTCKRRPQDRPGFKVCSHCADVKLKRSRSHVANWVLRSIEECRAAATAIHKEFVEKQVNA